MTGIVESWNSRRAFGFIAPLIGDPKASKVFFHITSVAGLKPGEQPAIPVGSEVKFDLTRGVHGPQAANLRVVSLNGEVLRNTPRKKEDIV
jgi:cold shock CspA family protein